ncbi:MAG TPA: PEP-CTERM sorting domain-containing protein [Bryobacteraceae bacterium]|jgi:hypothetical protein|nr:PEP-CTERM sorting domain-containing protein [Bryobacteraceae bacterium]
MRKRFTLMTLALSLGVGGLHASVVYNLRDGRFFPDAPAAFNTLQSATFTSTTSDSLHASFSTSPGSPTADSFDGLATVATGPFTLGTHNSVTINTATTTFMNLGIYSIVQSGIDEAGFTISGGIGTGYLLPTFHVFGTMSDSNPNAAVGDNICAGDNSCVLRNIFPLVTSGAHNVEGFYTPPVESQTSFQFGTPFTFFFFFGSGIDEFNSPNPGGTTSADLTLQFLGFQVVDGAGNAIPGAQIHSQFLDAVNTPEPGTAGMGLAVAGVLGVFAAWKKKFARAAWRPGMWPSTFVGQAVSPAIPRAGRMERPQRSKTTPNRRPALRTSTGPRPASSDPLRPARHPRIPAPWPPTRSV